MELTPIYHTDGARPCGRIAFYFKDYDWEDRAFEDQVVLPNGSSPPPEHVLLCGECDGAVNIESPNGDRYFMLPKKRT